MRAPCQLLTLCVVSGLLSSCTSLFYVHDPKNGVISAGQLPSFLKSVRCELVTFYELEAQRKQEYEKRISRPPRLPQLSEEEFEKYAYFNVSPKLYGAFTLELKTTDSASLGTGSALDYKRIVSSTVSNTTHVGPTASSQGTYDLIWSFLIRQDAKLMSVRAYPNDPVERSCYTGENFSLHELEMLADNVTPERTVFNRIMVDGRQPLAAWLRDNATLVSANYLGLPERAAAAEPTQMTYTFSIQAVAGVEAKYSVITPSLVPAALQAGGALQQNSVLAFYINGPGAAAANAAKSGTAAIVPGDALGSEKNPMHVKLDNQSGATVQSTQPLTDGKKANRQNGQERSQPVPRSPFKGYLLAPLPVFPPTPAQ